MGEECHPENEELVPGEEESTPADEEWNPGNFGNEEAMLWLQKLVNGGGESTIREAIECIGVYPEDEYLDAEYCSYALAAAEIIAAAKGCPPLEEEFPEEGKKWLKENSFTPDEDLLVSARKAVDRILNNSELKELWQEGCANDEWHLTLIGLRRRLS
jgi:hypothetical protein